MTGKVTEKMEQDYFRKLNKTLQGHHRAIPRLLLDLDVLDHNIATLRTIMHPTINLRIVVKSLPVFKLVDYVLKRMDAHDLMVFHQPFLSQLSSKLGGQSDVLLGKPMPVKTAQFYYQHLPNLANGFDPFAQVQWLVDTEKRIEEYLILAKALGRKLRLNLEIDIGLHRGGFGDLPSLTKGLQLIRNNQDWIELSGLMGYDPHVVKLPRILRTQEKALRLANAFYFDCKNLLRTQFPELWTEKLTFNGGGSPTLTLHNTPGSPLNDLSVGSCLVKPSTFDTPTLSSFQPACFIITPVLKKFAGTTLPALERMKGFLNLLNSRNQQSYFIYGGYWKADYCFPQGIQENKLFGPSTNQTMLNAPAGTNLGVDDFVFLRPQQSEFVFLQFGKLLTLRNGAVEAEWGVLEN